MISASWIASGGGIGRFRFIPGTAAAAIAAIIGGTVLWVDPRGLPLLAIAACAIGTLAIRITGEHDSPEWIVIDEMAGVWIAMLGLAQFSFAGTIAALIIYRILSLTKPGPIAWADQQQGAFATMADDITAGLITAAILYILRLLSPILVWFSLPVDQLP